VEENRPKLSSIPFVIAGLHFLLHIITNGNYGMFRDEFYYIACARRLAWGYVDQPPLSLAVLAGWMRVFGDSVESIRVVPAVAGVISILLTSLIAREMGGRRFAQAFAALCFAVVPVYLVQTGLFAMNALDILFWTLVFYVLVAIVKSGNSKLWILMGFIIGLGLLNKIGVLVLGAGLAVALILTPGRKYLKSGYLWGAVLIALVIVLPHVLWQVSNDWPTREFINNAKQFKIAAINPVQYFVGQVVIMHPAISFVWLLGLGALLGWKRLGPYRILGLIYIVALVIFMVQRSKVYYLSPAYAPLLAAGAVSIERMISRRGLRWVGPVIFIVIAILGAATFPVALPILDPSRVVGYQQRIGLTPPANEVNDDMGPLPQHFADRFGWDNMVSTIAAVYHGLDAEERAECVILTGNYGQAAAIDYLGPRYGLPGAISGHNNYYLWGPGDKSGEVAIAYGASHDVLEAVYEEVTEVAVVVSPYAMPWETNQPVFLCRGLKIGLKEAWRMTKNFI